MNDLNELRQALEAAAAEAWPGRTIVHGEGDMGTSLMLVGEAPGEQEEKLRRPFVGKAGKNLDEFLTLAGLGRSALYITNTVKFRPTKISAAGRTVNRPPTSGEIAFFRPFLLREIELVRPRVVVTLGNVPLRALHGQGGTIGDLHGRFIDQGGYLLYPMYHPASLIYTPALRPVYAADILALSASGLF